MKNLICFIMIALAACTARAQSHYTDRLKQQAEGEGKVVIVQDAELENIVNNVKRPTAPASATNTPHSGKSEGHKTDNTGKGKENAAAEKTTKPYTAKGRYRTKAIGYRIQIYTGGNSHQDKAKAFEIGERCKNLFPELSVYPRFTSPRWICRVGDFKNREDALKYAGKIRSKRISTEVHIVKCEVLLPR